MTAREIRINVLFILAGTAVFMLKSRWHGPLAQGVHDYGGNVAVSFSVFFLTAIALARVGRGRWTAAGAALLIVEAFELLNGFGVMANVYDPLDLPANAAGIGLGLAIAARFGRAKRGGASPAAGGR